MDILIVQTPGVVASDKVLQCNKFCGSNLLVQSQCNLDSLNLSLLNIKELSEAGTQNIKLLHAGCMQVFACLAHINSINISWYHFL